MAIEGSLLNSIVERPRYNKLHNFIWERFYIMTRLGFIFRPVALLSFECSKSCFYVILSIFKIRVILKKTKTSSYLNILFLLIQKHHKHRIVNLKWGENNHLYLRMVNFNVPRSFRSGCDRETVNVCLVNSTHASRMSATARSLFLTL